MNEIIEKSVEERAAKEKELASRPPLQDPNMAPTVSHDGDVRASNDGTSDEVSSVQDENKQSTASHDEIKDSFGEGGDKPENQDIQV